VGKNATVVSEVGLLRSAVNNAQGLLRSAVPNDQQQTCRKSENSNVADSWINENRNRSEPPISYDTFTESNSQMTVALSKRIVH